MLSLRKASSNKIAPAPVEEEQMKIKEEPRQEKPKSECVIIQFNEEEPVQNIEEVPQISSQPAVDIESQVQQPEPINAEAQHAEEVHSIRERETTAHTNQQPLSCEQMEEKKQTVVQMTTTQEESEPQQCRICLESEVSLETGPLYQPCICKGSLQFVHRECLWLQIRSQLAKKGDEVSEHQEVLCTVCKTPFRVEISFTNKQCSNKEWLSNLAQLKIKLIVSIFLFIAFLVTSSVLLSNSSNSNTKMSSLILEQLFSFFTIPLTGVSLGFMLYYLISTKYRKNLEIIKVFPDMESYKLYRASLIE